MYMSLMDGTAPLPDVTVARAISWTGRVPLGEHHPAGASVSSSHTNLRDVAPANLIFALTDTPLRGASILACERIEMGGDADFLRVDEVCFPVGAIAHRHTHSGAGIRHLIRGSLRIEADDHTQIMHVGDSWFEAAQSPVRAVALQAQGVTSFLRGMVITAGDAGKSTFRLEDPTDADLPRLQMTHRHIEIPI